MREPATPDAAKSPETEAAPGPSLVSIPDRRRIDSDVRAFLREPSTPWIVFDQEGRPPSQLSVGEVLPARTAILSEPSFFPATAAIDTAAQKQVEPSSLAVASDLMGDEPRGTPPEGIEAEPDSMPIPMRGLSNRVLGFAAAGVAVVSLLAVGMFALRGASHQLGGVHAATALSAPAVGKKDPVDIPPPDFDVSAAAAKLTATTEPAAPAAPPTREDAVKAAAKKFGRLTVAGDARGKDVFMDGKRMLGRGTRSFTVMCGTHSIAVGNKADAHDVDFPCTGTAEIVIGK
jgi:hypothetical protein